MKVLLAVPFAALVAAALPNPSAPAVAPGPVLAALTGDVRLEPFGRGASRQADLQGTLRDRDVVRTGREASARIESGAGWTALLDAGTAAGLRSLPERTGGALRFRRALELLSGSLTWQATAESALALPGGLVVRARQTKVRVSFRDGALVIDSESGVASIEASGTSSHVTLESGQRFLVSFNPQTGTFHFEVLEDNGEQVEFVVGQATILGTKGDIFDARVDGGNLDVKVTQGLIAVLTPDGKTQHLSSGNPTTFPGAGAGAIQGLGPDPLTERPEGVPQPSRRDPFQDVTDLNRIEVSPTE